MKFESRFGYPFVEMRTRLCLCEVPSYFRPQLKPVKVEQHEVLKYEFFVFRDDYISRDPTLSTTWEWNLVAIRDCWFFSISFVVRFSRFNTIFGDLVLGIAVGSSSMPFREFWFFGQIFRVRINLERPSKLKLTFSAPLPWQETTKRITTFFTMLLDRGTKR